MEYIHLTFACAHCGGMVQCLHVTETRRCDHFKTIIIYYFIFNNLEYLRVQQQHQQQRLHMMCVCVCVFSVYIIYYGRYVRSNSSQSC